MNVLYEGCAFVISGVKNWKRVILFGALTLAILSFIFGNSGLPREESAAVSSRLVQWLKPIFDPHDRIAEDVFHHYVRKLAHFTEFGALGFCLMGLSEQFMWCKKTWCIAAPTLLSGIAAATDETIQFFSPERGPGIKDVLLDCFGALCGIACMLFFLHILKKRKKKDR